MADNKELNAGSGGATIGTDEIAGVDYQRIKLIHGADGTNDGDVSTANGLPVDLRASNATVTVDGSGVTQPISAAALPLPSGAATAAAQLADGHNVTIDNAAGDPVLMAPDNTISTNNSTITPLGGDAVFTGTGDDCLGYASVTVTLDSSHDSATDGMTFQFSTDDTNWDDVYTFTYTAADGARRFQYAITARYFRIVYTNGSTIQTHFRVQTILHRTNVLTSIHRLVNDTDPDRSAQLVKAALIAQAAGAGDFSPVQATAGGNLKVSVEEFSDGVDVGNGTVGAETLRVTVASDSTGTIAATQSGAWDVGDITGTVSLPTGAATAANQLADGHNVTVDNGVAGAAVNIQDGGNTITVDGTVSVDLNAGTNTNEVVGDVAHSVAAAGNPVLVAGIAQDMDDTAPPNRVDAESDATRLATDFDGAAFVHPHGPQIWDYHLNTSSAQTDTSVHAAPGAGLSLYVTDIVFSSGAATAINLFFEEGASTVLGPWYLEATAGRGMSVHFGTPKKITANTALTLTTSAAIAHSVDVTGFVGQG